MPKKTKKEKLLAEYRRRLKLLETYQAPAYQKVPENKVIAVEKKIETPLNIDLNDEEKNIKKFFFIDLKKSLVVIGFILALEISLYFATMYTGLRLGR